MKKIIEEHYCDYCGVDIGKNVLVKVYSPVVIKDQEDVSFSYMIGTGGYSYKRHEFCSELCFVLDIAKTFGVKLTGYTDAK